MLTVTEWTSIAVALGSAATAVAGAYKWAKKQSAGRVEDIIDANVTLRKEMRDENIELKAAMKASRAEVHQLEEALDDARDEIRRLMREKDRLEDLLAEAHRIGRPPEPRQLNPPREDPAI